MTPQVMRWRQAEANPGGRDTTAEEDPFRIVATVASPVVPDPVLQWPLWKEIVTERRPVVVLSVSPEGATFPDLPSRPGRIRGNDAASFYLAKQGQRVVAIDSGRIDAVGNPTEYRSGVPTTRVMVFSPIDFSDTAANYEVVVSDRQNPDRQVRIPLPPGMLQAIRNDFSWMRR
jgi:hypothetical protein